MRLRTIINRDKPNVEAGKIITLEARGGIEPPIKVLQTFALSLGDRASGKTILSDSNEAQNFTVKRFAFHEIAPTTFRSYSVVRRRGSTFANELPHLRY